MKINEETEYEQLPDYVKEHLMFLDPNQKNWLVAGITFLMIDLVIAVPYFYPFDKTFLNLTLPFLFIIHIWAIRLLFKNAYSVQRELILFIAWTSVVGSYTHLLVGVKVAYYFLGITNIYYYALCTLAYLLFILILIVYQIKKYSNIESRSYGENEKRTNLVQVSLIASVFPGLGYTIAHRWLLKTEQLAHTALVFCFYFIAVFFCIYCCKVFSQIFFHESKSKIYYLS